MLDARALDGGQIVLHDVAAPQQSSRLDPGKLELAQVPQMLMAVDNRNVARFHGLVVSGKVSC
jgi:hypothetical protein